MPRKKAAVVAEIPPEAPVCAVEAAPAVESPPCSRPCRKASQAVVAPRGDGTIDVGCVDSLDRHFVEPLNGYVVISIDDQHFINDGVVVAVGEKFNPLKLEPGDCVLFAEYSAIDARHVAVKYDEVIAKIGITVPPPAPVPNDELESPQQLADPAPEEHGFDDYPAEPAPSISIELPTPAPAPVRGSAVVNKGGKPAIANEGIKQLSKPIRR